MSIKEADALEKLKELIKAPGIDSKALENPRMAKLRSIIKSHTEGKPGTQNPKMLEALDELQGTLSERDVTTLKR